MSSPTSEASHIYIVLKSRPLQRFSKGRIILATKTPAWRKPLM